MMRWEQTRLYVTWLFCKKHKNHEHQLIDQSINSIDWTTNSIDKLALIFFNIIIMTPVWSMIKYSKQFATIWMSSVRRPMMINASTRPHGHFLDMLKNWGGGWQESSHWWDEGKQLCFTMLTINVLMHLFIYIPLWRNDSLNKVPMNYSTYLSKQNN